MYNDSENFQHSKLPDGDFQKPSTTNFRSLLGLIWIRMFQVRQFIDQLVIGRFGRKMESDSDTLQQTVVLGIFLLTAYTASASFYNIVVFLFEQDSKDYPFAASLTLILGFTFLLLGITLSPLFAHYKSQLQIAALCCLFHFCLYLPSHNELYRLLVSVIGSIASGYGTGILSACNGAYMMRLLKKKEVPRELQGKYIAIQNGIAFGHQLTAGIITTFFLGIFGTRTYFYTITGISLFAYLLCKFLLDPLDKESDRQQSLDSETDSSLKTRFFNTFKYYPKMVDLIPSFILKGFLLAFKSTHFGSILPAEYETSFNVGILLLFSGGGAVLGGWLSGYLSEKIDMLKQGSYLFGGIVLLLVLIELQQIREFKAIWLSQLIAFILGFCLFFLEGWNFIYCIKRFGGAIHSFVIMGQVSLLSTIAFQVFTMFSGRKKSLEGALMITALMSLLCQIISLFLYSHGQIASCSQRQNDQGQLQLKKSTKE